MMGSGLEIERVKLDRVRNIGKTRLSVNQEFERLGYERKKWSAYEKVL